MSIEKIHQNQHLRELRCIVHSVPNADVVWYKDGDIVKTTEEIMVKRKDADLRIIFPTFTDKNFGKYVCAANNTEGETTADAVLQMNLPATPRIIPNVEIPAKEVTLKWLVESDFPILETELRYTKEDVSAAQLSKSRCKFHWTTNNLFYLI